MNKIYDKIIIALFCIMLCVFFFIGVLAPNDSASAEQENRNLRQMPDLTYQNIFSGRFAKDFEDYLADNIGFRSFFTDLSANLEKLKGINLERGRVVSVNKDMGVNSENQEKVNVLISSGRIMTIYKSNGNAVNQYIDILNGCAESIPESVRIINMIAPTSIAFYDTENLADSEKDDIEYVYKNLDKRIETVNIYDTLNNHSDEYIYFRTDHHWTQRGAFLAYAQFSEQLFGTAPELSEYTANKAEGFLGYMYNMVNDTSLSKYADTVEWFTKGTNYTFKARYSENGKIGEYSQKIYNIPTENEAPKYSIFMGGDHSFIELETDVKNGKTLLVIKDSYANAFLPFLTENYEKIIVIDPRSFYGTVSQTVEEYKADDVLFLNNISAVSNLEFIQKIAEIK